MYEKLRFPGLAVVTASVFLLLLVPGGAAQEKMKPETYQAQAMGQSTQLGQTFSVTIIIEEYSPPEDRQALLEAFNNKGSEGLYNALNKMHAKGRIAITGTLGYDISFARTIPSANGTTLRILTNRPIRFGEAWADSRSTDYDLSAMEIVLSPQKGKSTGTLLPACQFVIDKKTGELQIENLRNPWKLVNIQDRSKK